MIKRFSILRYASLLQSISLSYIKFNKKNRFHCNTVSSFLSKKMVPNMERPARAGEPVAWKKNANFSWPQRSRAVCITLLLHARISSAPLVFYTRERGEESVGRLTNRRRRLNVRGKWPAIWRLGTVGNTAPSLGFRFALRASNRVEGRLEDNFRDDRAFFVY